MPAAPYKRNQVEEAIAEALAQTPQAHELLLTRIKRLLETDRAYGRQAKSNDPNKNTYAFYSDEEPGRGVENWFSDYEPFALFVGLCLMRHNWAQGFVVRVLRRARQQLELEHRRILETDPKTLFDENAIRRKAQEGDLAFETTDPVLLVIASPSGPLDFDDTAEFGCAVARGPSDAYDWIAKYNGLKGGFTFFEVSAWAHGLRERLLETEPRRRGRS